MTIWTMRWKGSWCIFLSLISGVFAVVVPFNSSVNWARAKSVCVNNGGFLLTLSVLKVLSFPDKDSLIGEYWIDFEEGGAPENSKCPVVLRLSGKWVMLTRRCVRTHRVICNIFDGDPESSSPVPTESKITPPFLTKQKPTPWLSARVATSSIETQTQTTATISLDTSETVIVISPNKDRSDTDSDEWPTSRVIVDENTFKPSASSQFPVTVHISESDQTIATSFGTDPESSSPKPTESKITMSISTKLEPTPWLSAETTMPYVGTQTTVTFSLDTSETVIITSPNTDWTTTMIAASEDWPTSTAIVDENISKPPTSSQFSDTVHISASHHTSGTRTDTDPESSSSVPTELQTPTPVTTKLEPIPVLSATATTPSVGFQTTATISLDTSETVITTSPNTDMTKTVIAASVTDSEDWSTSTAIVDEITSMPPTSPQFPVTVHISESYQINDTSAGKDPESSSPVSAELKITTPISTKLEQTPWLSATATMPSVETQTTASISLYMSETVITTSPNTDWTTTVIAASKEWPTSTAIVDVNTSKPPTPPQCPITVKISESDQINGVTTGTDPLVCIIVVLLLVIFIVIPLIYIIYKKKKKRRAKDKSTTVMDTVNIFESFGVSQDDHDTVVRDILLPMNVLEEILKTASQTGELMFKIPGETVEKILCELVKTTKGCYREKSFMSNGNVNDSKVNNLADIRELFKVCFFEKKESDA